MTELDASASDALTAQLVDRITVVLLEKKELEIKLQAASEVAVNVMTDRKMIADWNYCLEINVVEFLLFYFISFHSILFHSIPMFHFP